MPMVASSLLGVALSKVAMVPLFSFSLFYVFVYDKGGGFLSGLHRVGFYVDLCFLDRVLVVVWLSVVW